MAGNALRAQPDLRPCIRRITAWRPNPPYALRRLRRAGVSGPVRSGGRIAGRARVSMDSTRKSSVSAEVVTVFQGEDCTYLFGLWVSAPWGVLAMMEAASPGAT